MIKKIKEMMIELCGDPKHRWWRWHIESVVKYAQLLADKIGGDKEILEIAAWLHDIKKIKGEKENHHIHGANEAEEILRKEGYPEEKIEKIKSCILTHSSDKNYPPQFTEAEILHNADALSHFDNFMAFAHWVYGLDKLSIDEGKEVLIKKYEENWNKLTLPEAKEIAKPKYKAIMLILGKQIN